MKLLIVEDQKTLNEILKDRFMKLKYVVDHAYDGQEALEKIDASTYDVVVLDIMLPKVSGLDVLAYIRKHDPSLPVILLTAKDQMDDKLKGFSIGADDYLVKPFVFDELHARVQAILRRKDMQVSEIYQLDTLVLDTMKKTVLRSGKEVHVSKTEYLILEYLMMHQDEVISRDRLDMMTHNDNYEGYSNLIDVYIKLLRKKIDTKEERKLIHTVRGFGYVMKINHET